MTRGILPPSWRALVVFASDLVAAAVAWVGAYWLRFSFDFQAEFMPAMWLDMAIAVPVQALAFRAFGLYRGIWVFASLPDLMRIALRTSLEMSGGDLFIFFQRPISAVLLILAIIILVTSAVRLMPMWARKESKN